MKVVCFCKKCQGKKKCGQKTIKKHLELYGLTQNLGDDGGEPDWSMLSEDGVPGMSDLDEYDDLAPITFEETEDDGDMIPNHHQWYAEWQEVIEPGEDAEWFNLNHPQVDEGDEAHSDNEDEGLELDDLIQWIRDEYDVEVMRDGAHLNHPITFRANTF